MLLVYVHTWGVVFAYTCSITMQEIAGAAEASRDSVGRTRGSITAAKGYTTICCTNKDVRLCHVALDDIRSF